MTATVRARSEPARWRTCLAATRSRASPRCGGAGHGERRTHLIASRIARRRAERRRRGSVQVRRYGAVVGETKGAWPGEAERGPCVAEAAAGPYRRVEAPRLV